MPDIDKTRGVVIENKKNAALQAALKLISENGFQGAPMSKIAKEANVSIGIIYHYFTGKDDLINALYIDVKTRLADYILKNYSVDMPVRKAFKHLFGRVIHYIIANPAELYFAEQYENSPLITESTRKAAIRIQEPVNALFSRAIEQDLLKDLPVEMISVLINSAIIALAKHFLAGKDKLDDDILDMGLDAIWDMIKR